MIRRYLVLIAMAALATAQSAHAEGSAWVSMLNGKNLDGWTSYFSGPKLSMHIPKQAPQKDTATDL